MIKGDKIELIPAVLGDRKKAYEWCFKSETTKAHSGPPDYPENPILTYQEFCDKGYQECYFTGTKPEGGRGFLIVSNGEQVGFISYSCFHLKPAIAELDIWMNCEDNCGKGYGSDAIIALGDFLNRTMGIRELIMAPSRKNKRAVRTYEKAGFKRAEKPMSNFLLEEYIPLYGEGDYGKDETVILVKQLYVIKNIAFLGIGGVGGYFGGKMTQLQNDSKTDINIFFIARGKHLEAIKENGLILHTKTEGVLKCVPTLATDNCEELPKLDICFICVKQYDLEAAVIKILPKLDTNTKIIPLLNGIDIYNRIRKITDQGIIFPACVYVGTHIKAAGVVEQNGGACTITFGPDPKHKDIKADDVCEWMRKAKIKFEWSTKHIEAIWSKYMFIASYGLVTASENQTLGEALDDQESSQKVKGIMKEIACISKAENISLPDNIVDLSYEIARNFPYEAKTSFQRDYELRNKPDERELFGQTIIDLGIKHGVDTTVTKLVYRKLNQGD